VGIRSVLVASTFSLVASVRSVTPVPERSISPRRFRSLPVLLLPPRRPMPGVSLPPVVPCWTFEFVLVVLVAAPHAHFCSCKTFFPLVCFCRLFCRLWPCLFGNFFFLFILWRRAVRRFLFFLCEVFFPPFSPWRQGSFFWILFPLSPRPFRGFLFFYLSFHFFPLTWFPRLFPPL